MKSNRVWVTGSAVYWNKREWFFFLTSRSTNRILSKLTIIMVSFGADFSQKSWKCSMNSRLSLNIAGIIIAYYYQIATDITLGWFHATMPAQVNLSLMSVWFWMSRTGYFKPSENRQICKISPGKNRYRGSLHLPSFCFKFSFASFSVHSWCCFCLSTPLKVFKIYCLLDIFFVLASSNVQAYEFCSIAHCKRWFYC